MKHLGFVMLKWSEVKETELTEKVRTKQEDVSFNESF